MPMAMQRALVQLEGPSTNSVLTYLAMAFSEPNLILDILSSPHLV